MMANSQKIKEKVKEGRERVTLTNDSCCDDSCCGGSGLSLDFGGEGKVK